LPDNLLKLENLASARISKDQREKSTSQGPNIQRLSRTIIIIVFLSLALTSLGSPLSILSGVHAVSPSLKSRISVNPTATAGNYNVGDAFTVALNLTNAPVNSTNSYNAFQVSLLYNYTILHVTGIDYSSTVLGRSNVVALVQCVDGYAAPNTNTQCTPLDAPGVTTLALVCLAGSCPDPMPVNGTLFKATFQVQAQGFSEIHVLVGELTGVGSAGSTGLVILSTLDGYFTTQKCGLSFCTPPVPFFTLFPFRISSDGFIQVLKNANATFDASKSNSTNGGGTILRYNWVWGDEGVTGPCLCAIVSHPFTLVTQGTNQKVVTLTIWDTYGADASISIQVEVILIFIDLALNFVAADRTQGVLPGAVLNVTVEVKNNSFKTENATVSVNVGKSSLGTKTLPNLGAFTRGDTSVLWDTSGWIPAVYRIVARIGPVRNGTGFVIENDTSNNVGVAYVQLLTPMPSSYGLFLGLNLVDSTLLGLTVVIGLGASAGFIGRIFRKKPLDEEDHA